MITRHFRILFGSIICASFLTLASCEDAGVKAVRLQAEAQAACAGISTNRNLYGWLLDSMAGGRWDGRREFTAAQRKKAGLDSLNLVIAESEARCAKATRAYNQFMN